MRQAEVKLNGIAAGVLTETDEGRFLFQYNQGYLADARRPAVAIAFPKRSQPYESDYLFPFFYNMLSEGANKAQQCRMLRIDENDDFGLLVATANLDTIGAVTVHPIQAV